MRLPPTLASLLYLLVCQTHYVAAGPVPAPDEVSNNSDWIKHLFDRQAQCAGVYCGLSSQYCCTGGSTCYTDAQTIARCGAPTGAAVVTQTAANGWQYFTTTYTLTNLVTVVSTYSTYITPVVTQTVPNLVQSTAICNSASQQGCGAICCNLAVETCAVAGRCTSYGAMTVVPVATTTLYSAPLRPTSGTGVTTITTTITPTTTQPFQTASTAGATAPATSTTAVTVATASNGLSPGAIAGIVIGVLAGILILVAICFCCILKTGFDALLGLFGLRNRRRERVEVTEERYSRHGGSASASRRETHTGWFGGGGRSTRVTEKRRSGLAREGGVIAAILLGLAGLWALLGFRRRQKTKVARSDVSYETYSDTYTATASSESSVSSDRRTRDTRRTGVTRDSRRPSSRPR